MSSVCQTLASESQLCTGNQGQVGGMHGALSWGPGPWGPASATSWDGAASLAQLYSGKTFP